MTVYFWNKSKLSPAARCDGAAIGLSDWGWPGCKRKDMVGLEADAWMPVVRGGLPEFIERQRQDYLKMRKMIQMKFDMDPSPE